MLQAVLAVPGVESAGMSTMLPLGGNFDRYGVHAQDKPLDNPELGPSADRYTVSAGFTETMRIQLRRGRLFTAAELADSTAQVAIVSEALAKRIWGNEDPVGKYIQFGGPKWKQVIGVVGNIRHTGLDDRDLMQAYVPERPWRNAEDVMALAVRTKGDPSAMVSAIYDAVRSVDPLQPVAKVSTMSGVVARSTAQRRLGLMLFLAFGLVALLLAAAGIYGVLAGSVEERTREIGVRSALGATPAAIASLVVRQAGAMAVAGLLVGGVGAWMASRYLRALLYEVQPMDPVAAAGAVAVIAMIALVACLIPARRAVRVDPMTALRAE